MNFVLLSLLSVSLLPSAFAATNIVYGNDNRMEAFEAPSHIAKLGKSTAAMVPTLKLLKLKDFYMLPPSTLKEEMNVCSDERFADQLSAGHCSGFLVGPDLLVTAGHCVTTEYDCQNNSWVFDYVVQEKTGRANVVVPAKNVYRCKRVVDAKLETTRIGKVDYALIQLERVATDRVPLAYRESGKISDNADVYVIGYPSGLPQKYAPESKVVENTETNYFKANLDTFGGNSGSSVFNAADDVVEGILVRGAKDYVMDSVNKCRRVNTVPQEVDDLSRLGESVSRITDIPSLKYRSVLMRAARAGDLSVVKVLADMQVDLTITDNQYNTALHYAVQSDNFELVKYLLNKGLKMGSKNLAGKSAQDLLIQRQAQLGDTL